MKRNLIYPFLLKCCDMTDDPFWMSVFEDLAYGYAPLGTFIYHDHLMCNTKNKSVSYKIEHKEPEVLYQEIYDLLHNKVEIFSSQEREVQKYVLNEKCHNEENNWSKIRKKNIREMIIEKYVLKMKNQHHLSTDQSRLLLSMIFLGLIFKTVENKNIHYSDGEIHSIDFIEFNDGEVRYTKEILSPSNEGLKTLVPVKKYITENWLDYLKYVCSFL